MVVSLHPLSTGERTFERGVRGKRKDIERMRKMR